MKQYSFLYSGTKEQFESDIERIRAEDFTQNEDTFLFKKEKKGYRFGVLRGGHSGGDWYCPTYQYKDNKLLISGRILYIDPWSQEKGFKKVYNKIFEIIVYIFLSPVILISYIVKGVLFVVRKIFKKPIPQSKEEKALYSLMIDHLKCEIS